MPERTENDYRLASLDFRRARLAANLERILARLRGESNELLSFNQVVKKLHAVQIHPGGLREIPIDAIVGSVGRYADYTRSFLPKRDTDHERWAKVMAATNSLAGLPPINVYQIGNSYFVKDGNHRVSVARQLGAKSIKAYVTEVQTRVPVPRDTNIADLITHSEYVDFLGKTQLHRLRPESDYNLSLPGKYAVLLGQIDAHRDLLEQKEGHEVPYIQAATDWYDTIYKPIADLIHWRGLLQDFPEWTEADLVLWIMEHRDELEKALGWQIEADEAAEQLVNDFSLRPPETSILNASWPEGPPGGPCSGANDRLFRHILVPISGEPDSWPAVDMALEVARREDGRLRGLHVVPTPNQVESAEALAVQVRFAQRCKEAGIPGKLVIEAGTIARVITERSGWAGVVVVKLNHPPQTGPLAALSPGFGTLVRRSARPVLAVPNKAISPDSALLAYDGGPKAREALFAAAYLACAWNLKLDVLLVGDDADQPTLDQAHAYLKLRGVDASYHIESGPVAETILKVAAKENSSLILMGGYGQSAVLEAILGSTVNQVLRDSDRPVLVCR